MSVVVPILFSALAIVEINKHVSQVLVQSALYVIGTLLVLRALLLLRRMWVTLRLLGLAWLLSGLAVMMVCGLLLSIA